MNDADRAAKIRRCGAGSTQQSDHEASIESASVRVLIVDTCYPAFLKTHYGRSPGLETQPYDVQWRALMDTFFGTADAYSHNLDAIGYDAHEVVVNCAPVPVGLGSRARLRVNSDRARRRSCSHRRATSSPMSCTSSTSHYLSDTTLAATEGHGRLLVGQIATEPPNLERLQVVRPYRHVPAIVRHTFQRRRDPDGAVAARIR